MGKKLYPTDTLKQARTIVTVWNHLGTAPILGPQGYENLRSNLDNVQELKDKIGRLEKELIHLRNERDTACTEIWDQVKRARAGIKSTYGDDSTEYQLAGGTRLSDRKRPRRKVTTTTK
jgi:hypothetical protein